MFISDGIGSAQLPSHAGSSWPLGTLSSATPGYQHLSVHELSLHVHHDEQLSFISSVRPRGILDDIYNVSMLGYHGALPLREFSFSVLA